MTKISLEGFFDNPFFHELNEEQKKNIEYRLIHMEESNCDSRDSYFYDEIINIHCATNKMAKDNQYKFRDDFVLAAKRIIIERFIQFDLLKFMYNEEAISKIKNLIDRKQIKSKMTLICANRIAYLMYEPFHTKLGDIEKLINNDLYNSIRDVLNNYIMQTMRPLKEKLDRVISGVKPEVYLKFEHSFLLSISDELRTYITSKHSNSLFSNEYIFGNIKYKEDAFLRKILLDDYNIWDSDARNLLGLLSSIEIVNGITHAKKLIDYIYNEACKNEVCKYLYDNKLPLSLSVGFEDEMIDLSVNMISRKTCGLITDEISDFDRNGFLYPLYDGYEEAINKGEIIFNGFIKKAYPQDFQEVLNLFMNTSNIIQDESSTKKKLSIGDMIDSSLFGYDINGSLKKFMYSYYKNFGINESILARLYYKCYIIDKYVEKTDDYLYEYFFEILHMISVKYGFVTSYVTDNKIREKNYVALKKLLAKYDLELSDNFKNEYIISLLDRKYATLDEVEKFAELEQLGDAIYEMAVDEILFYNPKTTLNHEEREKYVKAEAQIKVAKKIGLDKLYISNLSDELNSKFLEYETFDLGIYSRDHNYIADSLEMIIAVISKNYSIERAISFATRIILETYDFLEEPHKVAFDIAKNYDSNEDMDYLQKIYPNPFCKEDYNSEYLDLWRGLAKILSICILGNETKEKRNEVAKSTYGVFGIGLNDYYKYVVSYLYYGIEKTIFDFKPIVESNYR